MTNPLKLPLWTLQLATGAKSFRDNPLIGSKRLNAMGLHSARVRIAHAMATRRRARLAPGVPERLRADFDRDGFVAIRDFLPPALFAELRRSVLAASAPAREMVQGDTITRRIAIDRGLLRQAPALSHLIAHPLWQGMLRYAGSFDSEPLHYVQTILSGRVDADPDPQTRLHSDTFHPTVKAWFFLNDVLPDEGPFTYVPGSHRLTPERLAWEAQRSLAAPEGVDHLSARGSMRIEAAELGLLGLPAPRALAVPGNTLVVADTHGFHARGPSVRPSSRVEIWAYGRRNPFLPWAGLDPLSLPGIADRRVPMLWRSRDLLRRWIGQPWRDVGMKRPLDP